MCVPPGERFMLGLDLDGTCAAFYGRMREIAAELTGQASTDWIPTPFGVLRTGAYSKASTNADRST
jgi:hypothetical protein